MNKARRLKIAAIIAALSEIKVVAVNSIEEDLGDLPDQVSDVCQEEEEAFDNLPENLQFSERAETMEECINNLYFASESLEEAVGAETVEEAQEYIQEAIGALEEVSQ